MAIPVYNGLDLNSSLITNLAPGVSPTDAINLGQLTTATAALTTQINNAVAGFEYKGEVAVTTPLGASPLTQSGLQVIDGYQTVAGDLILDQSQASAVNNGIYVAAAGAWTRVNYMATGSTVNAGLMVSVLNGTNKGTSIAQSNPLIYVLNGAQSLVVGTDQLVFSRTGASINTSTFVNGYKTNFGDGSSNSFTITHNLNTTYVQATALDNTTNKAILLDYTAPTVNTIVIDFTNASVAPTTNQYRLLVVGL